MRNIGTSSIMSNDNKVRELWGTKFDVVKEGLAETQVVDFVDEIIRQQRALQEERDSLLACLRLIKGVIKHSEKLSSSDGQQAKSMTAEAVTEVEQDTQFEVKAIESDQVAPPAPPEATAAAETVSASEKELVLYQGELELAIPPPVDAAELLQFERGLQNFLPLKILGTDGEPSKGCLIIIFLSEPQPLVHSLKQIPEVKDIVEDLDIPSEVKGTLIPRFKNKHRKRIWVTIGKKELERVEQIN
jgi:hypothetical protein